MFVNIKVRDFRPFVTGSDESKSDHMAGKSVPRTLLLLHRSLSAQSSALPFIKWHCLLAVRYETLHQTLNVFLAIKILRNSCTQVRTSHCK